LQILLVFLWSETELPPSSCAEQYREEQGLKQQELEEGEFDKTTTTHRPFHIKIAHSSPPFDVNTTILISLAACTLALLWHV
jgi:hypothetical protein